MFEPQNHRTETYILFLNY